MNIKLSFFFLSCNIAFIQLYFLLRTNEMINYTEKINERSLTIKSS